MQEHILRTEMIWGSPLRRTNCAAISIGDTLAISFSGTMKEANLERDSSLAGKEGVPVKILSNRRIEESCRIV